MGFSFLLLRRYQILEARANGADTVLLIVAVLGVHQLKDLILFSRSQGMEPLVEVHTDREMEIALDCEAKVIGVNNRNLHTFQLDLETTARVLKVAERKGKSWRVNSSSAEEPDFCVAALSGITTAEVRKGILSVLSCLVLSCLGSHRRTLFLRMWPCFDDWAYLAA